jgi:hypothetical protein
VAQRRVRLARAAARLGVARVAARCGGQQWQTAARRRPRSCRRSSTATRRTVRARASRNRRRRSSGRRPTRRVRVYTAYCLAAGPPSLTSAVPCAPPRLLTLAARARPLRRARRTTRLQRAEISTPARRRARLLHRACAGCIAVDASSLMLRIAPATARRRGRRTRDISESQGTGKRARRGRRERAVRLTRCALAPSAAQDISLQVHSYNVLLHLCSGGNQAEDATTRIFAEQAAEARCARLHTRSCSSCRAEPLTVSALRLGRYLSTCAPRAWLRLR